MMHWGPGWGWGWGALMGGGRPGLWGLVIWLVVVALRSARPATPPEPGWGGVPTAPTIPSGSSRARYARGEIDEQEYRRRLEVIRASRDRH